MENVLKGRTNFDSYFIKGTEIARVRYPLGSMLGIKRQRNTRYEFLRAIINFGFVAMIPAWLHCDD